MRPLREQGSSFDPVDLVALAELYTTFNGFFKITHAYDTTGNSTIYFKVEETDLSSIMDRLDTRQKRTIEDMKFEAETIVEILNKRFQAFLASRTHIFRSKKYIRFF
jgi:hypothetical protein